MRPSSLAQAITEPVSDTDPISAPRTASTIAVKPAPCPASDHRRSSTAPMAAAEPPPMPLNSATICGMSVIATFRPQAQLSTTPSTIATTMSAMFCSPGRKKVTTVAMSMPTPAHWMPLRAVRGEAMRCRPSRNSVAATR